MTRLIVECDKHGKTDHRIDSSLPYLQTLKCKLCEAGKEDSFVEKEAIVRGYLKPGVERKTITSKVEIERDGDEMYINVNTYSYKFSGSINASIVLTKEEWESVNTAQDLVPLIGHLKKQIDEARPAQVVRTELRDPADIVISGKALERALRNIEVINEKYNNAIENDENTDELDKEYDKVLENHKSILSSLLHKYQITDVDTMGNIIVSEYGIDCDDPVNIYSNILDFIKLGE